MNTSETNSNQINYLVASDVTAAMLMVKNKSISFRGELNSIYMYLLQKSVYCNVLTTKRSL